MCNCELDEFGISLGCCDELLLGLCAIVFVVRILDIFLCEHLHNVVRNRVSEFDLQAYRDEFNTALDTDTELLRDNSILDRRGESTREGFAKEARVEVFCFNRAGVWRQRRIGLVFVQRSE